MTASRTHSLKHKPPASLPPSQWKSARTTNAIEQLHDRFNRRIKSHFHMESLEFLTSEQVSERLQGVSTVLEDNDRVGFVTLTGTFVFSAPKNSNPATFESAYAVFRAEVAAQRALGQIDDLLVYFDEVTRSPWLGARAATGYGSRISVGQNQRVAISLYHDLAPQAAAISDAMTDDPVPEKGFWTGGDVR